jgi:hypothetical protein
MSDQNIALTSFLTGYSGQPQHASCVRQNKAMGKHSLRPTFSSSKFVPQQHSDEKKTKRKKEKKKGKQKGKEKKAFLEDLKI